MGLTDEQAVEAGYQCECWVVELRHVPRARVNLDTRGLFKIVADRPTGKILGVHALADNAGDVILSGVYAVKLGMTVEELAETWAPYHHGGGNQAHGSELHDQRRDPFVLRRQKHRVATQGA